MCTKRNMTQMFLLFYPEKNQFFSSFNFHAEKGTVLNPLVEPYGKKQCWNNIAGRRARVIIELHGAPTPQNHDCRLIKFISEFNIHNALFCWMFVLSFCYTKCVVMRIVISLRFDSNKKERIELNFWFDFRCDISSFNLFLMIIRPQADGSF